VFAFRTLQHLRAMGRLNTAIEPCAFIPDTRAVTLSLGESVCIKSLGEFTVSAHVCVVCYFCV